MVGSDEPPSQPRRLEPKRRGDRLGRIWLVLVSLLTPVSADAGPPAERRYELSVELLGPRDAQLRALETLRGEMGGSPPEPDARPPGDWVGEVDSPEAALDWVGDHAFEYSIGLGDPRGELRQLPAPLPGGALLREHDILLDALIVSGSDSRGLRRPIRWPIDPGELLPARATWHPAALVPLSAPLFAAPSPVLPPASERFSMVERRGGLFVLGEVDRCTSPDSPGPRRCLRWAQVIARDGDRFQAGYLPAFQVAPLDGWVPSPSDRPRAHLLPSALTGDEALFLLLARREDGPLHRATIAAPAGAAGFPAAAINVDGGEVVVEIDGQSPLRLPIDATLDARRPAP